MAQDIHIADDGTLTVDGRVITPTQITTGVSDVEKALKALRNKKDWSLKNAEKLLAYGAGLVGTTNGFSAAGLPANIREWLIGASALVLAAIHVSTPATKTE